MRSAQIVGAYRVKDRFNHDEGLPDQENPNVFHRDLPACVNKPLAVAEHQNAAGAWSARRLDQSVDLSGGLDCEDVKDQDDETQARVLNNELGVMAVEDVSAVRVVHHN